MSVGPIGCASSRLRTRRERKKIDIALLDFQSSPAEPLVGLVIDLHPRHLDEWRCINVGRCQPRTRAAVPLCEAAGTALAYVDQGYTGEATAEAAAAEGIALHVVELPEAKRGFVLLPRRWIVERSFAWSTRCRMRSSKVNNTF
jgi:transposase